MAKVSVAFAVALVSVFVMQSALQGDRRRVVTGFRPGEAVIAHLAVLRAATVDAAGVPSAWPRGAAADGRSLNLHESSTTPSQCSRTVEVNQPSARSAS